MPLPCLPASLPPCLPACLQLVTAGDPALWLHLADEAMRFEKRWAVQPGLLCSTTWTAMQYNLYRNISVPSASSAMAEGASRLQVPPTFSLHWPSAADRTNTTPLPAARAAARRFAPLRGASLALPEEEDFLAAGHADSTIELLFGRTEWQASPPARLFCLLVWPCYCAP